MEITRGLTVRSFTGKEKSTFFVANSSLDYAYICNVKYRPLSKL